MAEAKRRGRPPKNKSIQVDPELTGEIKDVKDGVGEVDSISQAQEDLEEQKAFMSEVADAQIEGMQDEIGLLTPAKKRALEAAAKKNDDKLMADVARRTVRIQREKEEKLYKTQLKKQGYDKDEIERLVDEWRLSRKDIAPMTRADMQEILMTANPEKYDYKTITDLFYQFQHTRIRLNNQIDAVIRGVDNTQLNLNMLSYCYSLTYTMEDDVNKVLGYMGDRTVTGRWLLRNNGIGPALCCALLGNLDITKAPHAGNFISYCGLNDNNRPRITSDQAANIMAEIGQGEKILTMEQVMKISELTKWPMRVFDHINEKGNSAAIYQETKDGPIITGYDSKAVRNIIVRPPYSKKAKVICYKVGHQFQFLMNRPNSLYGRLIRDRRIYETAKNDAGDYADQAARILDTYNYKKGTNAWKAYTAGKLPLAHLIQRCNRYATKIFISNLHAQMMYVETGGETPELPWIIAFGGHKDYIKPEVPFTLE